MKHLLGILCLAVLLSSPARAQMISQNVKNGLFFMSGCTQYATSPFPPIGAICFDNTTGGHYMWNGTAFAPSGSQVVFANGGAGQTTATTAYFNASGNTTASTTETANLQMVLPFPATLRNLNCSTYPSPGPPPPTTSDTFTLRSGPTLGATMTNSFLTCTIRGSGPNNAQTCSDTNPTHMVSLSAGSAIDYSDVTAGSPLARVIACSIQMDTF